MRSIVRVDYLVQELHRMQNVPTQGMTLCHFQQEKVGKTSTDTQGHQQL